MLNEICKYARKSRVNKRPVGVVMAVKIGDEVYVGWSRCHKKDLNQHKFDRTTARNMARGRATAMAEDRKKGCLKTPAHRLCPHSLRKEVKAVAMRAEHYFKASVHECEIMPPQVAKETENAPPSPGSTFIAESRPVAPTTTGLPGYRVS